MVHAGQEVGMMLMFNSEVSASTLIMFGLAGLVSSYAVLWMMTAWYRDHTENSSVARRFDNDLRQIVDYGSNRQPVGMFASGQHAYYRRYKLHYLLWAARAVLTGSILLIATSIVLVGK